MYLGYTLSRGSSCAFASGLVYVEGINMSVQTVQYNGGFLPDIIVLAVDPIYATYHIRVVP